ncbi:MAG: hypothetical protein AAF597_12880 [Bacteroidota bacterium]
MDISQFPEHHRAFVLSGIVRNNRNGIAIRSGELEGSVLKVTIQRAEGRPSIPPAEMEEQARAAFGDLPYDLAIMLE